MKTKLPEGYKWMWSQKVYVLYSPEPESQQIAEIHETTIWDLEMFLWAVLLPDESVANGTTPNRSLAIKAVEAALAAQIVPEPS